MGKRHWTLITFLIIFNWFLIALICNSASVLKRRVIISVNFHHDKNIVWFHPHICNDNDGRIYHPAVVQFLISIDHVHFPKWMRVDMRPKFCDNFDLHKFLVNVAEVIKNYDPPKENQSTT